MRISIFVVCFSDRGHLVSFGLGKNDFFYQGLDGGVTMFDINLFSLDLDVSRLLDGLDDFFGDSRCQFLNDPGIMMTRSADEVRDGRLSPVHVDDGVDW